MYISYVGGQEPGSDAEVADFCALKGEKSSGEGGILVEIQGFQQINMDFSREGWILVEEFFCVKVYYQSV